MYVSRHGLRGVGVSCPACGLLAAKGNQWRKVRSTKWGEAILCECGKVLLASPDDDVDPVKPGAPYDETVYHTFQKPDGWRSPMPRLRSTLPTIGDWVYIVRGSAQVHGGAERAPGGIQEVAGAEGTVVGKDGDRVEIALAGNVGMGGVGGLGGSFVHVPVSDAFIMITEALQQGNLVRILKGEHTGRTGTIEALLPKARFTVTLPESLTAPAATAHVIIEHIERIYPDEIDTDALPPGHLPTRS